MSKLKYKVGDRVKINSLDWYNKNKNKRGDISFPYEAKVVFASEMSSFCGQIVTISQKSYTQDIEFYRIREDDDIYMWTDEMIECKVEDETQPKFKVGDKITNGEITFTILTLLSDRYGTEDTFGECGSVYFKSQDEWKIVEEKTSIELTGKVIKNCEMVISIDEYTLPEGYIFKDENGNVINARKIVLEKKKKEYPKTYEECCYVLRFENTELVFEDDYKDINPPKEQWKRLGLINQFNKLLICRDAYWKIAGDEMGLEKPWEPDWKNDEQFKYIIICRRGCIIKDTYTAKDVILAFPTEEMRDAFYKNFKDLIEDCKELL